MSNNTTRRRRPLGSFSKAETSAESLAATSVSSATENETNEADDSSSILAAPRRLFSLLLIPLMLSVAIILIFAERERRYMEKAELSSTIHLYTQDSRVCAASPDEDKKLFTTYDSANQVPSSQHIAHCGACSNCSTMHDMTIYAGTTKTLTDGATWCSTKGYLVSLFLWRGMNVYRKVAADCLQETVGFTKPCQECWLDDMACSIQACVFTCLKSVYLKREPKNHPETGELNECLLCDEKLCGPAFLACSGSNRRRQGIQSDIARGGAEICPSVTMDWTTNTNDGEGDKVK